MTTTTVIIIGVFLLLGLFFQVYNCINLDKTVKDAKKEFDLLQGAIVRESIRTGFAPQTDLRLKLVDAATAARLLSECPFARDVVSQGVFNDGTHLVRRLLDEADIIHRRTFVAPPKEDGAEKPENRDK